MIEISYSIGEFDYTDTIEKDNQTVGSLLATWQRMNSDAKIIGYSITY